MFKVYEYAIETGSTLALLAERETYAGAIRSGWNAIKEAPEFSFADIRAAFAEYEATVREIGAEGESFTLRSVTLDLSDILSERGKARIA